MESAVIAARLLTDVLREPARAETLDAAAWQGVLTVARAELLIGTLAYRLDGLAMPDAVGAILADARVSAEQGRLAALWEAEMVRRALAPVGRPVVLLKGTAFVAAGLSAGQGRSVGDTDILVPCDALPDVERALLAAGWEWVKPDPYDDAYYRRWMHELPPLIHRERDRIVDVHHTILPLTARPRPDADVLIAEAEPLGSGLSVLRRPAMVVHAAAHLIADGDLSGGLRNLWDIDRLCREAEEEAPDFYVTLAEESSFHGLSEEVSRALRLAHQIFETPVRAYDQPIRTSYDERRSDRLFRRRLLARDGWGRGARSLTRFGFYMRGHALRMPPAMLAQHLWIKWRKGAPARG